MPAIGFLLSTRCFFFGLTQVVFLYIWIMPLILPGILLGKQPGTACCFFGRGKTGGIRTIQTTASHLKAFGIRVHTVFLLHTISSGGGRGWGRRREGMEGGGNEEA